MHRLSLFCIIFFPLLLTWDGLQATPTTIIVRAKARDAKFIGTSIGGAYVKIEDTRTGSILAEGVTEGSTGNTSLIMKTPHERYMAIADEQTAKFQATIDIDRPVFVRISAVAPVNSRHASVQATTELCLVPGKNIVGDGVILEIPGFVVEVLAPRTHQYLRLSQLQDQKLTIQSNIVMMCGCTISDGGLWDSNDIEVKAIVEHEGEQISTVPLEIVSPNFFEAQLPVEQKGKYQVTVYAYQPQSGNTGVDYVHFIIVD